MPDGTFASTISLRSLELCEESAGFWAANIGRFAARMQRISDRYAITAAVISTITGLAAWGALAASNAWWAQLAVAVMATAAALVNVIPKVRGYAECAAKAAPLATDYGRSLGELEDAIAAVKAQAPDAQVHARQALDAFHQIKQKKDSLRPFPDDLENMVHTHGPVSVPPAP